MWCLAKVVAIALAASCAGAAASCGNAREGACMQEDETSLMQVRRTVSHGLDRSVPTSVGRTVEESRKWVPIPEASKVPDASVKEVAKTPEAPVTMPTGVDDVADVSDSSSETQVKEAEPAAAKPKKQLKATPAPASAGGDDLAATQKKIESALGSDSGGQDAKWQSRWTNYLDPFLDEAGNKAEAFTEGEVTESDEGRGANDVVPDTSVSAASDAAAAASTPDTLDAASDAAAAPTAKPAAAKPAAAAAKPAAASDKKTGPPWTNYLPKNAWTNSDLPPPIGAADPPAPTTTTTTTSGPTTTTTSGVATTKEKNASWTNYLPPYPAPLGSALDSAAVAPVAAARAPSAATTSRRRKAAAATTSRRRKPAAAAAKPAKLESNGAVPENAETLFQAESVAEAATTTKAAAAAKDGAGSNWTAKWTNFIPPQQVLWPPLDTPSQTSLLADQGEKDGI